MIMNKKWSINNLFVSHKNNKGNEKKYFEKNSEEFFNSILTLNELTISKI